MVLGSKRGRMTPEEYERRYQFILRAVPRSTWRSLWRAGLENGGEVVLLCYCRDSWRCHTHLLIDYAVTRWPRAFRPLLMADHMRRDEHGPNAQTTLQELTPG